MLANSFYTIAQVNFTSWGNLMGIIYNEEVVPFETSLRVLKPGWDNVVQTRHYGLDPSFKKEGENFLNQSKFEGLAYTQHIDDLGNGKARVTLNITPDMGLQHGGFYFCIEVAENNYEKAGLQLSGKGLKTKTVSFGETIADGMVMESNANIEKMVLKTATRTVEVTPGNAMLFQVRKGDSRTSFLPGTKFYHLYFQVLSENATSPVEATFNIAVTCVPDKAPVSITLDTKNLGRTFEGIGGNFRLQFPETDPQVIEYCLENLNVNQSRIGMWWSDWHPDEHKCPMDEARKGTLKPIVYRQMEMAQELSRRGIPVMVGAWFPPKWAALEGVARPGTYGEHLSPAKWEAIVESITKYLLYLKNEYGVEVSLFSFNEPEIGVRVVQSAVEHVTFIKMFGKSFAQHGLNTKLILGDTSNGTPYALGFVEAGLNDQSAHQYIGALGFHTWGGMETENLIRWKAAAQQLQVPLYVTEGGPDSEAHRNPDLFIDRYYQQQEIDLYVRLCAEAQVQNIMQWQLTADYSPLSGGGVYGNTWPLQTTQRFWNLKQLGLTPCGSFWLPATTKSKNITTAAYGDIKNGVYTLHMVNNGASRSITVDGLPDGVKQMNVYHTCFTKEMEKGEPLKVKDGKVTLELGAGSFVTLINL